MWESINFATDELMCLDMILMDDQVYFLASYYIQINIKLKY